MVAAQPQPASQDTYVVAAAGSLDGLREEADALASYLATMKQGFFGTPKERQKLEELARVVVQLQENIAASPTNPDEIAFLSDEAASLKDQFTSFAYPFLKREVKKIVDQIKVRLTQANTSDADLAVLATLAPVGTGLQQRINAAPQTDASKVGPLYVDLRNLWTTFTRLNSCVP